MPRSGAPRREKRKKQETQEESHIVDKQQPTTPRQIVEHGLQTCCTCWKGEQRTTGSHHSTEKAGCEDTANTTLNSGRISLSGWLKGNAPNCFHVSMHCNPNHVKVDKVDKVDKVHRTGTAPTLAVNKGTTSDPPPHPPPSCPIMRSSAAGVGFP